MYSDQTEQSHVQQVMSVNRSAIAHAPLLETPIAAAATRNWNPFFYLTLCITYGELEMAMTATRLTPGTRERSSLLVSNPRSSCTIA